MRYTYPCDIARLPSYFYLKLSFLAFDAFNLRIGEQVDVGMPADFDQLGRKESHRTVVGRKVCRGRS